MMWMQCKHCGHYHRTAQMRWHHCYFTFNRGIPKLDRCHNTYCYTPEECYRGRGYSEADVLAQGFALMERSYDSE